MKYLILFFFIIACDFTSSQDFKFTWETQPAISFSFKVKIERVKSKGTIIIYDPYTKDSIKYRFKNKDANLLISKLERYEFKNRTENTFDKKQKREYLKLTTLPDTTMCVIRGDTILKSNLKKHEYKYDDEKKEWYLLSFSTKIYFDGISYSGEYINSELKKSFSIYGVPENMNPSDYELRNMIYNFIKKYDKEKKMKRIWKYL